MSAEESFEIRLPQFEGPFDLLLFFIERDEMDIQDVPIARITDEFLDYIHHLDSLNITVASEFIFVAATLMRIKAKMLLPRPETGEGEAQDPRQDLIQKLIEYKKFKDVCGELRIMEESRLLREKRGNIVYDLSCIAETAEPGEELTSFDLYKLMKVYDRVMARYESRENMPVHTVIQYPYTIESQKVMISKLLSVNKKLDFQNLLKNSENKVHFVFNFLALLEMLQQELISIQTGLGFNDFRVEARP